MPDVTSVMTYLVENGLRSRVFNTVHDSLEMYIYKPERNLVYAFLTEIAAYNRQPYFDIPMHIDIEESDPDTGMIFREGEEINIEKYSLKDEIEKWNEKFPTKQLSYEAARECIERCIPIHGVLDGQRKLGIPYIPHSPSNCQDSEVI